MTLEQLRLECEKLIDERNALIAKASPETLEKLAKLRAYHDSLPVLTIDYDGGPILDGVKVQPCKA